MKRHFWLLALTLVSLSNSSSQTLGDDLDFNIDRRVTLVKKENPYFEVPGAFQAKVDLGDIHVNQEGIVQIELMNPFDEAIEFEKLLDLGVYVDILEGESIKVVPAGGSMKIKFKLSTPPSSPSPDVRLSFTFLGKPNEDGNYGHSPISLFVDYRLAGMIEFQSHSALLEIPQESDIGEISMEFVFSDPIQSKNIEVVPSESLRDVALSVQYETTGVGKVTAIVPSKLVEDGPIGGQVVVKDSVTGRQSSIWMVALKFQPIKLSPLTLMFRKNEQTGDYHATAIVKAMADPELDQEVAMKDGPPKVEPDLEISCFYRGRFVGVEKKNLGSRTYRLNVRIPTSEVAADSSEEDAPLTFKVQHGTHEASFPRGTEFK